jgi:hypothetical protein
MGVLNKSSSNNAFKAFIHDAAPLILGVGHDHLDGMHNAKHEVYSKAGEQIGPSLAKDRVATP